MSKLTGSCYAGWMIAVMSEIVLSVLAGLVAVGLMQAQAAPNPDALLEPSRGLIQPAREEVERQMERQIWLKISSIRERDGWGFLLATMVDPKGEPLDLTGTKLEEAAREGAASHLFCALLRRHTGEWHVVASCLGVTDGAWAGWGRKYGAPSEIFEILEPQ